MSLQLRNALALATILNRTVVLPEFWNGMEHYWGPHAGRLPGSMIELPFQGPADLVLDLMGERMRERESYARRGVSCPPA
jgi:hypothetical protein